MKKIQSESLKLYLIYHCCQYSHNINEIDFYLNPRTNRLIGVPNNCALISENDMLCIFNNAMDYPAEIELEHFKSFLLHNLTIAQHNSNEIVGRSIKARNYFNDFIQNKGFGKVMRFRNLFGL